MRIHVSKSVDRTTLGYALRAARKAGHGVVDYKGYDNPSRHGSRTHAQAFEVQLMGDGTTQRRKTMDKTEYAATYDSWGWFLAHLYSVDPTMIAGPYKGIDDFQRQTKHAYVI